LNLEYDSDEDEGCPIKRMLPNPPAILEEKE
jgi:hypothetical protein